jgi:NitT/TauT family transport system substrate-binding protein
MLIGCGLTLLAGAPALSQENVIRVGVLPFGTVMWEIETVRASGLDKAHGFRAEPVMLASNEAARIAFQSRAVETVVSDLLFAARLRSEEQPVKFLPFSATEGALMVPPGSTIRDVGELAGRRIGIAGGALDKSWLLLRAYVRDRTGLDLASGASPAFGAPPLITHKLEAGELDAALLYWNFCARLEAKGFRRLIGAAEIARSFGLAGDLALLGYLFWEGASRPTSIAAFAAASRAAKERLASSASAWEPVRPLMQAEDEATFEALKRYFIDGIPRRGTRAERDDADRLLDVLVRIGGERLAGPARRSPAGLYWDETS